MAILTMTNPSMSALKSIGAMKRDIESQWAFPPKLVLAEQIDPARCVLTGSGDSYVAASVACYLSKYRIICCYPSALILNPDILRGRDLYIISVSGRTAQNIAAAKLAKSNNTKTIAITADPESDLAKNCDRIMRIKYRKSGVLTSGTISFLSTMLMCLSLSTEIVYDTKDLRSSFEIANSRVDDLLKKIPRSLSSVLFLADGLLYPVACYGSLKMNEVLGIRSFPYSVEEYCHAPLFSLKKNDSIVILNSPDGHDTQTKIVNKLVEGVGRLNYSLFSLEFPGPSSLDCLFQAIFFVQLLAVRIAEKNGMADCFFVRNRDFLEISSECIY